MKAKFLLLACAAGLLVACGPSKEEQAEEKMKTDSAVSQADAELEAAADAALRDTAAPADTAHKQVAF